MIRLYQYYKKGDDMLLFTVDLLSTTDENKKFIEDLYNKYIPWLRYRAHQFVDDLEICDDLAHDCMFNMMKNIDKLKSLPDDKQRAYLMTSIDNTSKNYIKREKRMLTMKEDDSADLAFISDNNDIEDEIDKKCDYTTLKAGFDKLHERDKDIIKMKFDLELNDVQIAEVLHIKPDCSRMTVLRSVKKLKKIINELERE